MSQKITVQGKIEPETLERLDALAERIGWTRSETIDHCIQFGVKEGEKFADRMAAPVLGHFLRMVANLDVDDPEELAKFEAAFKSIRAYGKVRGKPSTS